MKRRSFFRNIIGAAAATVVPSMLKDITPLPAAAPCVPGIGGTTFKFLLNKDDFVPGDILTWNLKEQWWVCSKTEISYYLVSINDQRGMVVPFSESHSTARKICSAMEERTQI